MSLVKMVPTIISKDELICGLVTFGSSKIWKKAGSLSAKSGNFKMNFIKKTSIY
jgi:hypothetical protein